MKKFRTMEELNTVVASEPERRVDRLDPEGAGTDTRLIKAALELCLLATIQREDQYAYGIIAELEGRGFPLYNSGGVYASLRRLEKHGFIESYRRPSKDGPPRRYYSITAAGRQALRERARRSFHLFEVLQEIIADNEPGPEGY